VSSSLASESPGGKESWSDTDCQHGPGQIRTPRRAAAAIITSRAGAVAKSAACSGPSQGIDAKLLVGGTAASARVPSDSFRSLGRDVALQLGGEAVMQALLYSPPSPAVSPSSLALFFPVA
jgi:hypothetical protein